MNYEITEGIVGRSWRQRKAVSPRIWRTLLACCVLLTGSFPLSRSSSGQDWPQLLGPQRNGQSTTALAGGWKKDLKPAWEASLGSGYSGAAIAQGKVIVPHRRGNLELLTAFSLNTGEKLWDAKWESRYRGGLNSDDGPRAVPAISENRVVSYDAAGTLACVDLTTGALLWDRDLRGEYDAPEGYFGAGCSPLIHNGLVIACPGGKKGGIVALELTTGKTRWTSTEYEASYSSPILVGRGEQARLLVVTRLNTVLINLANGKVLDDIRFGSRGPTVNAATPLLLDDNQVFLTASYGIGLLALQVEDTGLTKIRAQKNTLSSQYNTPLRVGDRIVGINGREDVGQARLVAIPNNFDRDITPLWEKQGFGPSHLLGLADQKALALTLRGELKLLDLKADSFVELSSSNLAAGLYRALPALSDKTLVVRSSDSPNILRAYKLQ